MTDPMGVQQKETCLAMGKCLGYGLRMDELSTLGSHYTMRLNRTWTVAGVPIMMKCEKCNCDTHVIYVTKCDGNVCDKCRINLVKCRCDDRSETPRQNK